MSGMKDLFGDLIRPRRGVPVSLGRIAFVMFAVVLAATAHSAEPKTQPGWTQWRGPTFDGISTDTDLADSWPETGPVVMWTRELGQGYSSFIAVGPHVFTLTQTLYEQAVVCLDADTGRTIWSKRYAWPYDGGGLYPGPRSTPTWQDGRIYFAAPDGTIGCLNAADGESIWSTNPTRQFHGRGTDFGYSSSPAVIDGLVIVPTGGLGACVVALSAKDGTVVWSAGDSPASYASPLPITLNGQRQIIALLENSLAAFDLKTGELLWEDDLSQGYDEHSAAPLFHEPFLMIAGPFRSGAKCLRLPTKTGEVPVRVWESFKFSNDIASSVLVDGRVYGFDLRDPQSRLNRPSRGEYRCLDFETGEILWSTDKVGHANTIVADGKLILFNDRGEVIVARAGTDDYEELARAQVFQDEICWSPPALDRGRLYLRTQTRAVCLYLGQAPLKSSEPTQTISSIPRSRAFDAAPLLGGEREFPATVPEWPEFRVWYLWGAAAIGLAMALSAITRGARFVMQRRTIRTRRQGEPVIDTVQQGAPVAAEDGLHHLPVDRPLLVDWPWELAVFWCATLSFGVVGSPFLNGGNREFVFLWPLVLWAALQLTVMATLWAERQPKLRQARWVSSLAAVAFVGVNGLYFHLCRKLGLSIEWGFLGGLLPGFPAATLAAWLTYRTSRLRWLSEPISALGSFTIYYWSSAWLIRWWLRVGS